MVYDTAESDKTKGYKLVVLTWSNGETTIPIDFRFWFKANGKTKLELMQEMIVEWV